VGGLKTGASHPVGKKTLIGVVMDLNRLSAQQQWIILILLTLLLASPYAIKRFWPAYKTLEKNQQQLTKNQNTIRNPEYPESPDEDEDDVRDEIDELQATVDALSSQTDTLQNRIPPLESQDTLLELSAAARVNNINIIENVPYVVQRVVLKGADATGKDKKPAAQQNPAAMSREARRAARRAGTQTGNSASMVGAQPREGELIYDVVNHLDEARPLQSMTLQGTYFGLMAFIESIRNLPVQVTILSMNIDTQLQIGTQNTQNPQNLQGLPQLLRVSLVVAL
jgi:hypothetical protein